MTSGGSAAAASPASIIQFKPKSPVRWLLPLAASIAGRARFGKCEPLRRPMRLRIAGSAGYGGAGSEGMVDAVRDTLRRAGLVESARGRSGGYRLGRPASAISVAEILAAVEEDIRMTRCGGETAKPCMPGQRCLTHGLWDALGDQIAAFLDSVTLQEVLDGIPAQKQAMRASRSRFSQHPMESSGE